MGGSFVTVSAARVPLKALPLDELAVETVVAGDNNSNLLWLLVYWSCS